MLYFVRHGQTDWNAEHRLQARSDIPLNTVGKSQAQTIAALFDQKELYFTCVASSPLKRALETASIIVSHRALSPSIYPEFIEINLGDYEGCLEAKLRSQLGCAYDTWRSALFETPAPNGESRDAARRRVRSALTVLAQKARDENVLIVGHQAINMIMKAELSATTDIEVLQGYMQANNEIDIWDVERCQLNKRIRM